MCHDQSVPTLLGDGSVVLLLPEEAVRHDEPNVEGGQGGVDDPPVRGPPRVGVAADVEGEDGRGGEHEDEEEGEGEGEGELARHVRPVPHLHTDWRLCARACVQTESARERERERASMIRGASGRPEVPLSPAPETGKSPRETLPPPLLSPRS